MCIGFGECILQTISLDCYFTGIQLEKLGQRYGWLIRQQHCKVNHGDIPNGSVMGKFSIARISYFTHNAISAAMFCRWKLRNFSSIAN